MQKKKLKKVLNKAQKYIPGISGLLGKRPDMYLKDGNWPIKVRNSK